MVTILKAEVVTTRDGTKSYKAVELNTGMKCSMWPDNRDGVTPGYADAITGAIGDAEITTQEKGGKTYHNMISWQTKVAPTQSSPNGSTSLTQGGEDPWPAKDRGMDCESAYKSSAPVVVALIASGEIKNLVDAQAAMDTLATQFYGNMQLARRNELVYPGLDIFADE